MNKFIVFPIMSSVVFAISSTLAGRKTLPLQLFNASANSVEPSLFLSYGAVQKPLSFPPLSLAQQPPESPGSPDKTPPEFPNRNQDFRHSVPLELQEISTVPEVDPPAAPPEGSPDPPPLSPGPNPGPDFPVPPLPSPPGPDMPRPPTPSPPAPDIPFPKPPEVDPHFRRPVELPPPQPDVVPPIPPGPEIVPPQSPPHITPPTC